MRIGIDGGCLSNRRGFGRFARRLVEAMARQATPHRFVVFVDRPSAGRSRCPRGSSGSWSRSARPQPGSVGAGAAAVARHARDGPGRGAARLDLIYFPASTASSRSGTSGRVVVTMHDTLALAHPELVFPSWQGRIAWRLKEQPRRAGPTGS